MRRLRLEVASNIFSIIVVFMYIFIFRIIGPIDSAIAVGILLVVRLIIDRKMQKNFATFVSTYSFLKLILTIILLFIWSLLVTAFNGTSDYSFIKTLIHLLIQLMIGVLVYSYLKSKNQQSDILKLITIAFIIQSIVVLLGIINIPFRNLLLSTKTAEQIQIADHYGYRGANLCGSSFFGLAVGYAILFIIFFSVDNKLFEKSPLKKMIFFVVILISALSAGRTSIIGLAIAMTIIFLKRIRYVKLNTMIKAITAVVITMSAIGLVYTLLQKYLPDNILGIIGHFKFYITEFFIDNGNGRFKSTSTSALFENMFFIPEFKTFIIGDGLYNVESGYYMSTDSGIMRPLLYGGVLELLLLLVVHLDICNLGKISLNNKRMFWTILVLTFVLQIKGEVLGFSIVYNSILFLIACFYREVRTDVSFCQE